jgi:peptidoglycan/LPS O-acetylase OafA/YrhL
MPMRAIGIDYLRLFASLSVMFYHFGYFFGHTSGAFGSKIPIIPSLHIAWVGWIGVEIFFVISGYVIAYSAARSTPFQFAKGRVRRIWPAVILCATLSAALAFLLPHTHASEILPAYLRTLVISPKGPWVDGVYWTLVSELAFYFLIYVTLAFRGASGMKFAAIGLTIWSSLFWIVSSHVAPFRAHASDYIFGVLLLRHGCFFALGMFIYSLQNNPGDKTSAAFACVALFACAQEIFHQAIPAAAIAETRLVAAPLVIWCCAVLLMLAFVWTPFMKRRQDSAANRVAQTLGRMTYPIYLLHSTIGSLLLPHMPTPLGVALSMAVVVVLSGLIVAGPEQMIANRISVLFDRVQQRMANLVSAGTAVAG